MAKIRSANPDVPRNEGPTTTPHYMHGAESRKSFIPMVFQVTSPFDHRLALLPHALVMHVNPSTLTINRTKKVERVTTKGGYVEFHWGDNLTDISAEGNTGAFLNITTGLASIHSKETIAWKRLQSLHDIYHNNGSVWDPYGNIVLQGSIMVMFDRGTYLGTFRNFSYEVNDGAPYSATYSWSFKVEQELLSIPDTPVGVLPELSFQAQNTL